MSEKTFNELSESILKLKEIEPELAALKKAYEKDPKKPVLDNIEKLVKDLYSTGGLPFDKDDKKFAGNLEAIYKALPQLKENLYKVTSSMGGDIKYQKSKVKSGYLAKYGKKLISALSKYLKESLTPETVLALKSLYAQSEETAKKSNRNFKDMVRDYVGRKVSFTV